MVHRIVADTNVIVSSVLTPGGNPSRIFDAIFNGQLHLILSQAILNEVQRVFSYEKIQKELKKSGVTLEDIDAFLSKIIRISTVVPGKIDLDIIKNDPDDNMFLACAIEGQASYIISGDQHLISIHIHEGIEIVNPFVLTSPLMSNPSDFS